MSYFIFAREEKTERLEKILPSTVLFPSIKSTYPIFKQIHLNIEPVAHLLYRRSHITFTLFVKYMGFLYAAEAIS
jgi:hypothetical protein